jgi:hypothetical protein
MFSAIPPMLVVEDLHAGAIAGDRARVNALNGHAFRKEVELGHWTMRWEI